MNIEKLTLEELFLLGEPISFYRAGAFYDKVVIEKTTDSRYYNLLNNCRSNADLHKDKSVYKYSLYLSNTADLRSLKLLEPEPLNFQIF